MEQREVAVVAMTSEIRATTAASRLTCEAAGG